MTDEPPVGFTRYWGIPRWISSPILVGRAAELERLHDAFDAAVGGRGTFAIIEGEAGIGKTRLLDEFTARAVQLGAVILKGECFPFTDAVPYAPVLGILRGLGFDPADLDFGSADRFARTRLFAGSAERLAAAATKAPLVVLVEDTHWIDGASGDFLLFLAQRVAGDGYLLVVTRRTDEFGPVTQFTRGVTELTRGGRADIVGLGRLDASDIDGLIGAVLGRAPSRERARQLRVRGDGNPFFTEELIAAGETTALPPNVSRAVLDRVGSLSGEARAVVDAAAVIGRRVEHRLVAAVADVDEAELIGALREAVQHAVLQPTQSAYAFRHALMQEAIAGELLPGQRARLHERVAVALEANPELASGAGALAAELTLHWDRAGQPSRAIVAAIAAGRDADSRFAPLEASRHFRFAMELWTRVVDPVAVTAMRRRDLLKLAAVATSTAGEHAAAEAIDLERLAEIDADEEREAYADALLDLVRTRHFRGGFSTFGELQTLLAEHIPEALTPVRARVLIRLSMFSMVGGRTREGLTGGREALDAANATGGGLPVAGSLAVIGFCNAALGAHESGLADVREALDIARRLEVAVTVALLSAVLLDSLIGAHRYDEAVEAGRGCHAEIGRLGVRSTLPGFVLSGLLVGSLVLSGRWDEADSVSAAQLAEDVDPARTAMSRVFRALMLSRRGHLREAADVLGTDFDPFQAMSADVAELARAACFVAEVRLACEDFDGAARVLQRALERLRFTDRVDRLLDVAVVIARLAANARVGPRRRAQSGDALPALADVDDVLALVRGQLGEIEERVGVCSLVYREVLELALAERSRLVSEPDPLRWHRVAARTADVHLAAYAWYREAEAHLESGDREEGAAALVIADELADDFGAARLRADIRSLASRAGTPLVDNVGPKASAEPRGRFGLTKREEDVLRCVADGLSNAEIGDRLFISRKTASVHVSHILQKLGVETRGQAAAIAYREGVVGC